MLESYNTTHEMSYKKLSPEECEKRGILGRLIGPIADFKRPTRNGRFYSEELWEKFFNDPITKEKIKERVFVGELGHPADRTEVDMEKIAICLSETPKKGDDGRLYGVFDILNTPNGKILKTLCDYGSHIGVSSRGTGDTYDDINGNESVDADTFECDCWDAVLVPAVKEARLQYVTESYKGKTLKQALCESLEKVSDEDKKVMTETLKELDIDINNPEKDEDIDNVEGKEEANGAADNDGAAMVEELQKALIEKNDLQNRVITLQEQLSVCHAKDAKLVEENAKYRNAVVTLGESQKALRAERQRVAALTESIASKDAEIAELKQKQESASNALTEANARNRDLHKLLASTRVQVKSLNESVDRNKSVVEEATMSLKKENATLRESIEDMKKNSAILEKEHQNQIQSVQEQVAKSRAKDAKLLEQYKKLTNDFANRYIATKAIHLGVSTDELLQKLPKNYTPSDVDRLCEEVERQLVNVSRLPFNLTSRKVRLTESDGRIEKDVKAARADDEIDDTLAGFLNNQI